MKIAYRDTPLFLEGPSPKWLDGNLVAVPGGFILAQGDDPGGRVVSCQPGGDLADRDPHTAGSYEVLTLDTNLNLLRYNPGVRYAVVFRGR